MQINGSEEMELANDILRKQLPPRMQKALIPVPSPGRASLVVVLYKSGKRGRDLDYTAYDDEWNELAGGSSSFPGEYFDIVADGKKTGVKLADFLPELYGRYGEDPARMPARSSPCVRIMADTEDVWFFNVLVMLEPKQFRFLMYLYRAGRRVPDYELRENELVSPHTDPSAVVSKIRRAFRVGAKSLLRSERRRAEEIVEEIFPAKKRGIGYVIGRRDLFVTA